MSDGTASREQWDGGDGEPRRPNGGGWWPFRRRNERRNDKSKRSPVPAPRAEGPERREMSRLDTMEELELIQFGGTDPASKRNGSLSLDDDSGEDDGSFYRVCSLSSADGDLGLDDLEGDARVAEMLVLVEETPPMKKTKKEFDVSAYMSGREMTKLQEKWNALTVVPNPLFCLYYLLAGMWLRSEAIEAARSAMENAKDAGLGEAVGDEWSRMTFTALANGALADENGCIGSSLFPNLHALPPVPVVAVAVGIILHAPFSFMYHWHYATKLPPGAPRIEHWSRRLDHSFIHICSAFISYGTSGNWDYFLANLMFNLDCVYRQFKSRVRPRTNKIRIFISVMAYTIPILRRGDTFLFCELWTIFAVCGWLFMRYPIGGWSHCAFHIIVALAPPLVMSAACHLVASQEQIRIAARCAVLAGK